jgi:hypothetical protein
MSDMEVPQELLAKDSDLFSDWKSHPMTKAFLLAVETDRIGIQDGWKAGSFLKNSEAQNAYEGGMVEVYDMIEDSITTGNFVIGEE